MAINETDVNVTTNSQIDRDWLALRQWARRTLEDARAHAITHPEVTHQLRLLETPLVRIVEYCQRQELPVAEQVQRLADDLRQHIEADQRGR